MKAYVATDRGAELIDRPEPQALSGAVVVRIRFSALNRVDLRMATGYAHGPTGGLGETLGLEWAGDVIAVGDGVSGFAVGDRVSGMGGGGFADQVAAYPPQLFGIPDGVSYEQAVCYPVGVRTMYEALCMSGALTANQTVLIQGASTAVGLIGLQIARLMGAKTVIGTSTTPERVDRLTQFDANLALNSRDDGWVEAVLAATDGAGVDLVIDQVSGTLLNQTMAAIKVLGRIVNVGRLGGNLQPFDAELHAARRISLIGVTFRSRTLAEFAAITDGVVRNVLPHLHAIRVPIAATFPFADLPQALAAMDGNQFFGKVVVAH